MTDKVIDEIKTLLSNASIAQKDVLTTNEAVAFTGLSKSYIYKLTMRQEIPHYKPSGKCIYFDRLELEQWMKQNRVSTQTELENKVQTHCMKGGRR